MPISIPSALITAKPPANVEQQRAIITRVKKSHQNFCILRKRKNLLGYDTSRFC
jgi:hypothetical protein